jgi:hypothetical protein
MVKHFKVEIEKDKIKSLYSKMYFCSDITEENSKC